MTYALHSAITPGMFLASPAETQAALLKLHDCIKKFHVAEIRANREQLLLLIEIALYNPSDMGKLFEGWPST